MRQCFTLPQNIYGYSRRALPPETSGAATVRKCAQILRSSYFRPIATALKMTLDVYCNLNRLQRNHDNSAVCLHSAWHLYCAVLKQGPRVQY